MTPPFLIALMQWAGLGRMKLGPEDRACIDLGVELRAATVEGRLRAVFTKIPHEVGALSKTDPGYRLAQARYAKQQAMGFITGSCDYVFTWRGGAGWIEMKSSTGRLTDAQGRFRDWCALAGVQHALCRSKAEALDVLRGWGVLVPYHERGWAT